MEQETSIRAIIHNWKHGYRALLHMRCAAAFGFPLTVVGLVGVVGFVLAIIRDNKLREKRKQHLEKLCLVPGLENLGNNCFLNVILQASKMHEQHDDKVSLAGKSMRTKSDEEGSDECTDPASTKWFCISDSQVCSVLEKDVLAAEASLLFYERIVEG
ncbi:hypothetical protein HRI_002207200 [Hibiscus trionum]|uniref:Uncharacterized protein n=1 Tax=Hibiscus trionum TaxID=183268 RepID=A0A9W7HVZ5_HIBTR|nr:hypothetical protein HRI_002207200 [Hibiscus trionum]